MQHGHQFLVCSTFVLIYLKTFFAAVSAANCWMLVLVYPIFVAIIIIIIIDVG